MGCNDFGERRPNSRLMPGRSTSIDDILRGAPECLMLDSIFLESLSASEDEIRVSSLSVQSKVAEVDTILGAKATEKEFRDKAEDYSIVHVSSHGIYFSGDCSDDKMHGDFVRKNRRHNPLFVSGLAFAGFNEHSNTLKDRDGFLSSDEILDLDLSKVNLMILSACETGKGTVEAGEGIFGLRRSLQLAGVGSMICSLWSISDSTSARLVPEFLDYDLTVPAIALKKAMVKELESLRQRQLTNPMQTDHPFYWASFVSVGDLRMQDQDVH